MKKIITLLLSLLLVMAMAQEERPYKAVQKSISLEVNLNPFTSNPISISYIRLRRFIKDGQAVRLGVNIGGRTESGDEQEGKTFNFSIRPGFEYHIKGTERLSPYFGVETEFSKRTSNFISTKSGNSFSYDGIINTNGEEQGFNRFGGSLLVGLDYYPIRRLYIGTELSYGFAVTNFTDILYKQGGNTTTYHGGSTSSYGASVNRTIRLGFLF